MRRSLLQWIVRRRATLGYVTACAVAAALCAGVVTHGHDGQQLTQVVVDMAADSAHT